MPRRIHSEAGDWWAYVHGDQLAESYFIACDSKNKTIIDNFLLLNFDAPADGMYALFFDSYTIADLDGNSMFLSGSLDEATGVAV